MLVNTLAASFIWGINTLFLLDAGLTNTEAFAANAFFTAGMVLFEVPTGVVADTGAGARRTCSARSRCAVSTLLYCCMWRVAAPFWAWAVARCCSAWASRSSPARSRRGWSTRSTATGYPGHLETVLGRGRSSRAWRCSAAPWPAASSPRSPTSACPYLLRAALLVLTFVVAFVLMRDTGLHAATRQAHRSRR